MTDLEVGLFLLPEESPARTVGTHQTVRGRGTLIGRRGRQPDALGRRVCDPRRRGPTDHADSARPMGHQCTDAARNRHDQRHHDAECSLRWPCLSRYRLRRQLGQDHRGSSAATRRVGGHGGADAGAGGRRHRGDRVRQSGGSRVCATSSTSTGLPMGRVHSRTPADTGTESWQTGCWSRSIWSS